MRLINNILSLFYPRLCAACGDALQQNESCICLDCMLHLPETQFHKEHFNPLRSVFDGRVPVEEVSALMSYKKANRTQKILHNLKYKGQKEIGAVLGEYFGGQLITEERWRGIQYILPIPLHPKKQRKRGYNQAALLARRLSEKTSFPVAEDLLVRSRDTKAMRGMTAAERQINLKRTFHVYGNGVRLKSIMLIDDIYTTGATIDACAGALLEAGAEEVSFLALAIGEDGL